MSDGEAEVNESGETKLAIQPLAMRGKHVSFLLVDIHARECRARRWRPEIERTVDCSNQRKIAQLSIGAMSGSPFCIARRYASRAPMRCRYDRMFGYGVRLKGR